ncbi:MAG: CPBP family intramembrane metalloprotease [Desulfamplus sp.]|nr:CPBP family intramembrane metalloprotease [Desulfamplus sp.]MBF0388826.1 CPBP family intramembrane metalloprotease [Desulfamplus sp.]
MAHLNLKTLLIVTAIILICEIGLKAIFKDILMLSKIESILCIRLVEALFMLAILKYWAGFKYNKNLFYKGIKIGVKWSIYFALATLIVGVIIFFTTKIEPTLFLKSQSILNLKSGKLYDLIIFLFAGCIVSPVAEELFFRGFLYHFLRRYGVFVAIFISTSIFGLSHISETTPSIPIVPLIGGILFAASYEYSKSLVTPIIIHTLGNSAIFAISLL